MKWGVLLAGGSGTRFWPLSTPSNPKQLLPLAGNQSTAEAAVARLDGLIPKERLLVVTGAALAPRLAEALVTLLALAVIGGTIAAGFASRVRPSFVQTMLAAGQAAGTPANAQAGEAAARTQCATCHKVPPPDVLPRAIWRDEVARMFLIRNNQPEPAGPPGTAARMVLLPPDWQAIVRYYESGAPDKLPPPEKWPAADRKIPFRRTPKVAGRVSAPRSFVLVTWGLPAWCAVGGAVDLWFGHVSQALFAGANAALFTYAAVTFVGLRPSLEDMLGLSQRPG